MSPTALRLIELAAREQPVEFAGGYVRTDAGVQKERGAGAHLSRHAGKYIGTAIASPLIGLPVGWLIDRNRRKHNIAITRDEPLAQPWRAKGQAFAALTPGMIEFARTNTQLLRTRRVPWKMKKTGHGTEIRVAPTRASVPDAAQREAKAFYTDDIADARRTLAHVVRGHQWRPTAEWRASQFSALTPGMIEFGRGDQIRRLIPGGQFVTGDLVSTANRAAAVGNRAQVAAIAEGMERALPGAGKILDYGTMRKQMAGWARKRRHLVRPFASSPVLNPFPPRTMSALTPGMIAFERTRDSQGQFAPEDLQGPTPQNMTRAYGHPLTIRTRPKTGPLVAAGAGGLAVGAAGGALLARKLIRRA